MNPLATEKFLSDPRVEKAMQLLLQTLADHQRPLTTIRPPDPERKLPYDQLLATFAAARGGNLFFPYLGAGLGHGPLVELSDGSVKYDLISGIGVHHFGHSNPTLINACLDAALRDTVMQGNLQQNIESTTLAADLLDRAKPGSHLNHCFLTTSGAMANENALKLAFHKKPGSTRIIAFEHTFAGRTMALAQITDKPAYRVGLPSTLAVDYLPFYDPHNPEGSTARALEKLRTLLTQHPNQHAALWCELILGEGGFYEGSHDFFTALATEAHAHQIPFVADEVQTFGRTSRLFAFQHFGLEDLVDIVTVGKMLQICATLFSDAYRPGPGLLSQTFTGATSTIFTAHAILQHLLTPDLFGPEGRNLQLHARFASHFHRIASQHPTWIRGPFGIGGMVAFTPFDGSEPTVKKLLHALYANGLIAFYNGSDPTRIRFLPPVPVMTDPHIDTVCTLLESTMAQLAPSL